jgi:hypothetical protein
MTGEMERRARLASRAVGAAMLGAATILVPKADPTEHWATPVDVLAAVEVEQAPDPDEPLPGGALIAWPLALLRLRRRRHRGG